VLTILVPTTVLENEIVTGMRLLGLKSINEITPNMVECLQEVWK
jgi:hypothetical protein